MRQIVEAVIEPDGRVRLLEPIAVDRACKALVAIFDEPAFDAVISEPSLAADWCRPEEDAAWKHLQTSDDSPL